MTDEGESETVKWVESKGAKYAYGYDRGGKLARYFNVTGIPAAVLVDAKGTVIWQGHPGSLNESQIQKAVEGALPKPLWEWTAAAKNVKAALLKRQYKLALDEAAKLGEADSGPTIVSAIQGIVKSRVEAMQAAYSKGDYLGAENSAHALLKEFDGLPEKEAATKVAADVEANKDAQPIIKAQKQIAKLRAAELRKTKEIDAALEDLAKIEKGLPGSYAASEAAELIQQLKAKKRK